MKCLPCMSVVLAASFSVLACGDDAADPMSSGMAGSGSSMAGSAPATAGSGSVTPGAAGTTATTGGTGSGQAGASSAGTGGSGGTGVAAPKDIIDTAVAVGSFTELAKALTAADLVTALKGVGPFTVFAPTDMAFADFEKANPGALAKLSKDELTAILKYHVVSGTAKSTDLKDDQVFVTLNGAPVLVDLTGGVKVSDAKVTMPDVIASNGVIHVIDKIILPPTKDIVETAIAAGTFTALAGALTSADLVATLKGPGPFTVFAPTDTAFGKLASVPTGDALKNVLLYHVVSGAVGSGNLTAGMVPTLLKDKSVTVNLMSAVKINASTVTSANIIAKNGVIHVVDTVLIPQ